MYYTIVNGGLLTAETEQALTNYYDNVKPLPADYEQGKYIVVDNQLILNEHFDEEKALEEKERVAKLHLTGADVERALFEARNMDFEDLIVMVQQTKPEVVKCLKIELKAKDFYRGNKYIDEMGVLLGISKENLDNFFESNDYKYLLPQKVEEVINE